MSPRVPDLLTCGGAWLQQRLLSRCGGTRFCSLVARLSFEKKKKNATTDTFFFVSVACEEIENLYKNISIRAHGEMTQTLWPQTDMKERGL